jgi:hypothetical protein
MNRHTAAAAVLAALAPIAALAAPATAAPTSAPGSTATSMEARAAAAAYKVTARINRSEVVAGEDRVRITGRVTPRAAGEKVTLLQRREGSKRWRSSGKATIKPTGRFVLKDAPDRPGVRYYRVLKPAGDGFRKGLSKELELAVWAWDQLAYRPVGANAAILRNTSPQFGTVYYGQSLSTQTPGTAGYIEYTLGDKCRSLRASYALTDDSASGATGSVTVSVDGVVKATHALTTGVIVRDHVIDVTNAFRIRFDAVASASPAGTAAVGTPEVLCLD